MYRQQWRSREHLRTAIHNQVTARRPHGIEERPFYNLNRRATVYW